MNDHMNGGWDCITGCNSLFIYQFRAIVLFKCDFLAAQIWDTRRSW